MEKSLLTRFDYSDILDNSVKDIFKRVAGFNTKRTYVHPLNIPNPISFVITTHGDYKLSIVMCADKYVFIKMTEHMKRLSAPEDRDIPIYITEFYNILCGHIVSTINKTYHSCARFSIPKFIKGHYVTVEEEKLSKSFFYDCGYGIIKVETLLYE